MSHFSASIIYKGSVNLLLFLFQKDPKAAFFHLKIFNVVKERFQKHSGQTKKAWAEMGQTQLKHNIKGQ